MKEHWTVPRGSGSWGRRWSRRLCWTGSSAQPGFWSQVQGMSEKQLSHLFYLHIYAKCCWQARSAQWSKRINPPKPLKAVLMPRAPTLLCDHEIKQEGRWRRQNQGRKWVSACFCNSPKLDHFNHLVKLHWILLTRCCQMSIGPVPQAGITTRQQPQQSPQGNQSCKKTIYHWTSSYPTTGLQDCLCLSDKDHSFSLNGLLLKLGDPGTMVCKGFSKRVWLGSLSGVWSLEEEMGVSSKPVVTHKLFKVCFKY